MSGSHAVIRIPECEDKQIPSNLFNSHWRRKHSTDGASLKGYKLMVGRSDARETDTLLAALEGVQRRATRARAGLEASVQGEREVGRRGLRGGGRQQEEVVREVQGHQREEGEVAEVFV